MRCAGPVRPNERGAVTGEKRPRVSHRWACTGADILIVLVALTGCQSSSTSGPTSSTTTTVGAVTPVVAGGGSAGVNDGATPRVSAPPVTTTPPVTTVAPTTTVADTTTAPSGVPGPYQVKQTRTLGHETISGSVCDVRRGFMVNAIAPAVSWNFVFTPTGPDGSQGPVTGTVAYAYNISSAGESHDATGSYAVSGADPDGTRHVSLTVRDHVVFHGFDGVIPVSYSFDLVPTATCA